MFKANEQNYSDMRILSNLIEVKLIKEKQEICTYADMSIALGGRDVQGKYHNLLERARKDVEKQHRVYIGTVNKQGVTLISDLMGAADKSLCHIRKTAKRSTTRILNACNEEKMHPLEKTGLFARISALSALALFTKSGGIKKIETALTATGQKELPTADTLRLFEK